MTSDRVPRDADASLAGLARLAALIVIGALGLLSGCGSSHSNGTQFSQVSSIEVGPPDSKIAMGLASQYTATGIMNDGSKRNLSAQVAWSSSNPAIAWMGTGGTVATVRSGTATIMATLNGVSGSTSLTVTPATLMSIELTPPNPSFANGLTLQLVATGIYSDNSTHDLTSSVTWGSSSSAVASVSNSAGSAGLVTALSPGSVTVTASLDGISANMTLTVTTATLVSIGVTPMNSTLPDGLTTVLKATGVFTDHSTHDLTSAVTWSSSAPAVASIDDAPAGGLVSALSLGTTQLTATLGSIFGSTTLTVSAATLVSIGVTPANPGLAQGLKLQFKATGTYTDNSTQDLTATALWSSSNPALASVSNASGFEGLATALGTGAVTVTAAMGTIQGSATLNVTPATLVSIAVIPATPSIADGTTQQFAATGTYTDGSAQPLTLTATWSSSDTTIATVSNAAGTIGLASSRGQGTVTVTATVGTIAGSTVLTVTPATLVSIAVTPVTPSITSRSNEQFAATGTYTDGSTQNLTTAVTWSSSTAATASISNASGSNGLATAAAVGTTSITAALGGIGSPAVTLTITAAPEYAYVANQNENTVSEFAVGAGGGLTLIGTVATGNEPNAVVVDPSGRYVYVANWNDGSISEYAVGSDGTLTNIGTGPAGSNPASITIDATGQYVYVANLASNTISQYAIGSDGVLTVLGTIAAASGPISIVAAPTGHYVYVADETGNEVSEYSIGAGGLLTSLGTAPAGSDPQSVTVDPSGRYAYVANWNDATVSAYSIASDGTLTTIGTVPSGGCPESVIVDPAGPYVYAENYCSNTVSEYAIGTGGVLSAIGTVATGNNPWFISIDPTGSNVYVVNFSDSTVSEFSIGSGGALGTIGTVPTGSGPNAIIAYY